MIENALVVAEVLDDHPKAIANLSSTVNRRVIRVGARYQLDTALRRIAIDLLGGSRPDELPTAMSAWVQAATDAAVAAVCDTSLAALVEAIDAQLAKAPVDVVRRLDDMATRHDAGII